MAETKVTVKTVWGSKPKSSSMRINAKTLGGCIDELKRLHEWGKFDGAIGYVYKADRNKQIANVTLKPSYTIKMPTWSGYKKAPKACKDEWDRMWKKLDEHEEGHRQIHLETLTAIEKAMSGKTNLSIDQFETDLEKLLTEGEVKQKKFDATTGHGSKKGVTLNIAQECA